MKQLLRRLADGSHSNSTLGYVLQVHCPGEEEGDLTVVDHVKLIRNRPELRFEGRIHEQVLQSIRRLGGEVAWTNLFVVHSGADQSPGGKQRKYERDLRILKLDLVERPEHPFVLFNLGMTYQDMGEHAEAVAWLRRSLEVSQRGESHVRKAFALLAASLQQLSRYDEASEICERGLEIHPRDVELQFRRAILAHEAGRHDEAITAYRSVLADGDDRHFTSMDRGLVGHKARHNLALVFSDRGDHALAELQWRRALDEQPRFAAAVRGLGQSLIGQDKLVAAQVLIDDLRGQAASQADRHWLAALAAERSGQSGEVQRCLKVALALAPDHLPARQDYCRWLFHHGTLDSAEAALRDLIRQAPQHAAAYHNLGIVLSRQGRNPEAILALSLSVRLRPSDTATRDELIRLQAATQIDKASAASLPAHKHVVIDVSPGPELPECYARRVIAGEASRFHCLHPLVHIRHQIVEPAICQMCTRWQEPRPIALRPDSELVPLDRGLSCQFIGGQVGLRSCAGCRGSIQVKVYACGHPNRRETTLAECRACGDFARQSVSANSAIGPRSQIDLTVPLMNAG